MAWQEKLVIKNKKKKIIKKYPNLSPKFIFLYPAYNFRNNEIGAVIGIKSIKIPKQK